MSIKVGGTVVINDARKGTFETVNPGTYATADRPSSPEVGDVIYDTDEDALLVWDGTEWVKTGSGTGTISISKAVITPSTDVEEGDTLVGSAAYAGNVEPTVLIHKWYLNGALDVNATTNSYRAKEGEVTYRLCITDPNNTTPVEGPLSDPVTVSKATVPVADMHGLRIDRERQAHLSRTPKVVSNLKTWTWSGWFKPTFTGNSQHIFDTNNSPQYPHHTGLYLEGSDRLHFRGFGSGNYVWQLLTNRTFSNSEWHHVVAVFDTTQATASERARLYIDGERVDSFATAVYPAQNYEGSINGTVEHQNGGFFGSGYYDGYLSDVYFIDGYALEPEIFGKEFDLGWGPLDNSVIKDNIKVIKTPYSLRPNYDEKWSDTIVSSNGGFLNEAPATDAFNGNVSGSSGGYAQGNSGSNPNSITFTPGTAIPYFEKVEVYIINAENQVSVNGGSFLTISANKWETVATGSGTLSSLKFQRASTNGASFSAIRIDGRELLDGPALEASDWAEKLSTTSAVSIETPENAFNNNLTNAAKLSIDTNNRDGNIKLTADLTVTQSLRIFIKGWTAAIYATAVVKIDNVEVASVPENQNGWYEVPGVSGSISSIDVVANYSGSTSHSLDIAGYEVDDKILLLTPPQWDTTKEWSSTTTFDNGSLPNNPALSFDGSTSTKCSADATDGKYTTTFTGFGSAETVELFVSHASGNPSNSQVYINEIGVLGQINNGWATYSVNGLDSISWGKNGGTATDLHAVKVDGKILVDQGSFGVNGYYLAFDPDSSEQTYSDYLYSDSGEYRNGNYPTKAFDGNSGTIAESSTQGTSSTMTFDPPDDMFTGSLIVELGAPQNVSVVATDGSGSDRVLTSTVNNVWSGTLNGLQKIVIAMTSGSGYCDLRYLKINNTELKDYTKQGFDSSGKFNSWIGAGFDSYYLIASGNSYDGSLNQFMPAGTHRVPR